MNLNQQIQSEIHRVNPGAKIEVDAAAGVVKIQIPPGEDVQSLQQALEGAGFQGCRVVNESGQQWMACTLKPGLLERLLGKLRGIMTPQEAAFVLTTQANLLS